MIAFRVSKSSADPIFVCDLCHRVVESPDDGNLLAIDDRTHELVVGWLVHKKCDRQMRGIMPFRAATIDIGPVAGSTIKHVMSKTRRSFSSATVKAITDMTRRLAGLDTLAVPPHNNPRDPE